MVTGMLQQSETDYALAITGIAGPSGGTPEKPIGLAYVAVCRQGAEPVVKEVRVNPEYDRKTVKFWFSQNALTILRLYLLDLLDANEELDPRWRRCEPLSPADGAVRRPGFRYIRGYGYWLSSPAVFRSSSMLLFGGSIGPGLRQDPGIRGKNRAPWKLVAETLASASL